MLAQELIQINQRISGRELNEHREINIQEFPNFVQVSSNRSTVILTYTNTISVPYPDNPNEGIFHIGISGKKNDLLLNFLNAAYIKSKCVVLDVIKFNLEVQNINIDIKVIETDGNLFGLCVAGINAIISSLKLKAYFLPKLFSYCAIDSLIISDPDADELECADWVMNILMRSTREILFTEKIGAPCGSNEIMSVMDLAFEDARKLKSN